MSDRVTEATAEAEALASPFSPDYATARLRFLNGARGFRIESLPIGMVGPSGEELAVDAAILGSERPERVLVVSSGLHGVEGFFGSAAQLALLSQVERIRLPGRHDALILLHALNPYGFAHLRRFNEGNVDLNRNLLIDGQTYQGSPPLYARLNSFLNPEGPPSDFDLFLPRSALKILRFGKTNLKVAIARGQYDFPRGIFFGGRGPSRLHDLLASNLPRWIGAARHVVHLDFHTGLGRWGTYKLLLWNDPGPGDFERLAVSYGAEHLGGTDPAGIAYPTRGDLGTWCRALFPDSCYDCFCAEFGTYPSLTVLAAIRAENQAHHWLAPGDPALDRARRRLREIFAPEDPGWRPSTVARALDLIDRASRIVFDGDIPRPSSPT